MGAPEKLPKGHLDGRTFQVPLDELAVTIALKIQREGDKYLQKPIFVLADLYYLLRQSHRTYDLFFFINADERRRKDVDYRIAYSVVTLPLVRTMIDCLYNITAILQNPSLKGYEFRESGYKLALKALEADEQRYGGDPKWDAYIEEHRRKIDLDMRLHGITQKSVRDAKAWPTLSGYLRTKGNAPLTAHQEFLKKLTYGFWQEYSGISHATFQGLQPIAVLLAPRDLPLESQAEIEAYADQLIATHIPRVAAILLCTLTEIQAYFGFDGAHINERLHKIWNPLLIAPEIKELFDERYEKLMRDKGINPE